MECGPPVVSSAAVPLRPVCAGRSRVPRVKLPALEGCRGLWCAQARAVPGEQAALGAWTGRREGFRARGSQARCCAVRGALTGALGCFLFPLCPAHRMAERRAPPFQELPSPSRQCRGQSGAARAAAATAAVPDLPPPFSVERVLVLRVEESGGIMAQLAE